MTPFFKLHQLAILTLVTISVTNIASAEDTQNSASTIAKQVRRNYYPVGKDGGECWNTIIYATMVDGLVVDTKIARSSSCGSRYNQAALEAVWFSSPFKMEHSQTNTKINYAIKITDKFPDFVSASENPLQPERSFRWEYKVPQDYAEALHKLLDGDRSALDSYFREVHLSNELPVVFGKTVWMQALHSQKAKGTNSLDNLLDRIQNQLSDSESKEKLKNSFADLSKSVLSTPRDESQVDRSLFKVLTCINERVRPQ